MFCAFTAYDALMSAELCCCSHVTRSLRSAPYPLFCVCGPHVQRLKLEGEKNGTQPMGVNLMIYLILFQIIYILACRRGAPTRDTYTPGTVCPRGTYLAGTYARKTTDTDTQRSLAECSAGSRPGGVLSIYNPDPRNKGLTVLCSRAQTPGVVRGEGSFQIRVPPLCILGPHQQFPHHL